MKRFSLEGRTAIVTGAGGNPSIGRAHALLLAQLGANVVVNDVGPGALTPNYQTPASAEAVAQEICAAGGRAVSDTHSVATVEGAQAIVKTALDTFGAIDILVNNAAFSITAAFDRMTPLDFERHIQVNLLGTAWMCRAVWPHMQAQGRGRIVNTASGAVAGAAGLSAYAASKGGVFSLTRALASEGEACGIKVNTVNPGGFSRLVMATQSEGSFMWNLASGVPAELCSPVVAYLSHDDCPVSGECLDAAGGMVRLLELVATKGIVDQALTVEIVAKRWNEVIARDGASPVGIGGQDTLAGARPYDPATRD